MSKFQKIIFLSLFAFQTTFLFGQKTITAYTAKLHQADMLVIQDKFGAALEIYKEAFKLWEKPFALDYYNAMMCANAANQPKNTQKYALKLVELGCELSFFEKKQQLTPFQKSKEWAAFAKKYEKSHQLYLKNTNFVLRAQIIDLNKRDQYWRLQDPQYTVLRNSTFKEDDRIMKEIIPMIEKNGYPNEYKVGVFIKSDTIISSHNAIDIIILHNYTKSGNYKTGIDMTTLLLKEVAAGNMPAEAFAYLNDRAGSYKKYKENYGMEGLIWKLNSVEFYIEKDLKIDLINQHRAELGLCPLEEARQKALYQLCKQKGYFSFLKTNTLNIMNGMPDKIVNSFYTPIKCP